MTLVVKILRTSSVRVCFNILHMTVIDVGFYQTVKSSLVPQPLYIGPTFPKPFSSPHPPQFGIRPVDNSLPGNAQSAT